MQRVYIHDFLDILTLNPEDLPPFPWHIAPAVSREYTERLGYVAQPVRARHS